MGYRHHLYAVPKKQIAEIQACKTNQDWLDFAKRHSYKIDYGARDDGIWIPYEEYGFALCSKEDFKAIIEAYRQKIVNYFKGLLDAKEEDLPMSINQPKEEKWRYVIESKLRYWQEPWTAPINLDEDSDCITHS